ncbi:hypothetical protein A0H81_09651 [Grifola frondosa]|uniref:Uncharacterized protein n=1 Tax=Grifola frondosa TaxID=5627 RepID=A0A1C7LZG7_GRIFR|nr:hypothetical protein A0H81_09651 [Grifola frondosa]
MLPNPSSKAVPPKKQATRGRTVASRYLNPTEASASKSTPASTSKALKQSSSSQNGSAGVRPSKAAASRTQPEPSARAATVRATNTVKGKPLAGGTRMDSSLATAAASEERTRQRAPEPASAPASDPLQVAGQVYAWQYMKSTLEGQLESSKVAAAKSLERRARELSVEEADVADSRVRFEAEHLLDFYEEIGDVEIAQEVPMIVTSFMKLEETCADVSSRVLQLASSDGNVHVNRYNEILDCIGKPL